jgi:hypothetical protein
MRLLFSLLIFLSAVSFHSSVKANMGFGINTGFGLPYLGQLGLSYQINPMFGVHFNYNTVGIKSDGVSLSLTMPEFLFYVHPFSGSFFVGGGFGKENLKASATEPTTNLETSVEVEANTTVLKFGWMWGADDGGFWAGLDYSHIMPSGSKTTIVAPGVPTTSKEYIDTLDAANKFGETSYGNLTFFKIGYIF